MKQFGTILKFELQNFLKNKIFVGVTLFLMLVIGVVMFLPRFISGGDEEPGNVTEESGGSGDIAEEPKGRPVMLITAPAESEEAIRQAFAAAFTDYEVQIAAKEEIRERINEEEAECAFVLEDLTSYTYYVSNLSMYDQNPETAAAVLQNLYRIRAMISSGLTPEQAEDILSVPIEYEVEMLGKDQMQNFFYTYIMIFALYMVILLYGQMVATNVATEKSSRAMELLITSAKPTSMMFGKVIASCLAGLLQLICIFGSAVLFYQINKGYWGGNAVIDSIFAMPVDLLLYMLLFFILGFLIYAFMFGAVGSTASKLEDINTSVMPITLLFIIAFIVVMFSMSSGNVDNVIMKVCSFIPFTSPMAMFTRLAMSTVPFYEILVSVVILIGSAVGVGILSAKIYRVGVLLYGTTPRIGTILKSIRKA